MDLIILMVLPGLLAFCGAWYVQSRADQRLATLRHSRLDACIPLLDDARIIHRGADFPLLFGKRDGIEIQVSLTVDTLPVRKLPSLWLMVSLVDDIPVAGKLDLLMRGTGSEGFTNFHRLRHTPLIQNEMPEGVVARTDDPGIDWPLDPLSPHLDFFQDLRAKELIISPTGLRLTRHIADSTRANYLVYRQARFDIDPVDPALVGAMVDRLIAIRGTYKS